MVNLRLLNNNLFSFIIGCIVAVAGWTSNKVAADPQPKAPQAKDVKEKTQAPMVYIAVMANYKLTKELPELMNALGYATGMAVEFNKIGYQVRFVTESKSFETAKKSFKDNIAVGEINNGDDLMNDIQEWIKSVAEKQPPVAILVLSGHGEERVVVTDKDKLGHKSAVFLSRDDTPGRDGVCVDHISEAAAQHGGVPTAIIYDACRLPGSRIITSNHTAVFTAGIADSFTVQTTGKSKLSLGGSDLLPTGVKFVDNQDGTATLTGKPNENEHGRFTFRIIAENDQNTETQIFTLIIRNKNAATRAGVLDTIHIKKAARSSTGNPYPTILYSTVSGEAASDKDDLIWNLTKGLKWDRNFQQFLQWHQQAASIENSKTTEPSKTTEITLYHWFCFGLTGMLRSQKLAQPHEIVVGDGAPLTTTIYRVTNDSRKPPEPTRTINNLIESLKLDPGGDFLATYDRRKGLVLTRTNAVSTPYQICHFESPSEFDITNKYLVMDVVASGDDKKAGNQMTFTVKFFYAGKDSKPVEQKVYYPILFNRLTRVEIPISSYKNPATMKPYALRAIAILAEQKGKNAKATDLDPWPEGVGLTIVEQKIVPQPSKPITGIECNQISQEVLHQRWVPLNDPKGALKHPDDKVKTYSINSPDKAFCKIGGDISPRIYVTRTNKLDLEVNNAGKDAAKISVELLHCDESDGESFALIDKEEMYSLPPGVTTKISLTLDHAGYANYLAINTNGTAIRLIKATISQPPPKK